jgi:hypothetical protein
MGGKDWVRLSLDAGTETTFVASHRPKTAISLEAILNHAQDLKARNPAVDLGYSFVIVWEGITVNDHELCQNVHEMTAAVELAQRHGFDYVSFKPCLIRLEGSQKESLLDNVQRTREAQIVDTIKTNLDVAKAASDGSLKILESVNLRAMLRGRIREIKRQPRRCHMQFFRTVVTPTGIFHCPAFRGVEKAKIAEYDGYTDRARFDASLDTVARSIESFDAERECGVVACFYHHVNWWMDDLIQSNRGIDDISAVEDDNFFL